MDDGREITRRITGGRCNDFVRYQYGLCYRFLAVTDAAREHIGGAEFLDVIPEHAAIVQVRMNACGLTVA